MKNINITLIGDATSGKSTLLGHLLYQAGEVNSQTIQKYEKEAASQGKAEQKFAYVCYTQQERSRGRTIDSCMRRIQTQEGFFTFFDTPGNQQKFKETVKSLTMVDVALLVISTEQQATQLTSTTKEIIVAIYSLGIKQLIVAINKLDLSFSNKSFNQQKYNEVKQECLTFLNKVGFKENYVHFVPVSGLTGDNLIKKSDKTS